MTPDTYQLDPRIPAFDLASAPDELRASEEATCLLEHFGLDTPVLQVWISPKTVTIARPKAGQETTEVTLWEYHLHRWLIEVGLRPGDTAYVIWRQNNCDKAERQHSVSRLMVNSSPKH